ncbi:MAG: methylglyoxal synthase [Evtepia sp.]
MNQRRIALIAHDNKKADLIRWCATHVEKLKQNQLFGTGTTARLVTEKTGLSVQGYMSGPLGGDLQIGTKIVEGDIDILIFFSDPLTAQPHDPDVKALTRIAQLYDVPIALNRATADFILESRCFDEGYVREIQHFSREREEFHVDVMESSR